MVCSRKRCCVGLLLAFGWAGSAAAGNWHKVIDGKSESVDIDQASIAPADKGATAWSRISLSRAVQDPGGAFDAIHAQNFYDCRARRFTTLRRAYYSGEVLVREEVVARHRANAVVAGSIDERLFNIACRPSAAGETPPQPGAGKFAGMAPAAERAGATHADLKISAGDPAARPLTPVADSVPVPAAEKPKLIVLPPIDKAAAAQAAAGGGQGAAVAPSAAVVPAPTAAARTAPSRPTAASIANQIERRQRELHYANSGPPRVARKKPAAAGPAAAPAGQRHWSYDGATGPEHWAGLHGDYAACAAGKRQSPIDIRDGIRVNLEAIKFDYRPTPFRIIDNGRTVAVRVGGGLGLSVTGKRYELMELHFHRPAEERIEGRVYDMSVHLVHRNDAGQIAVVAVLLEKGGEHPLIQTLWNNLPLEQDTEIAPQEAIDVATLLPENRAYWTYMGSLTTPPCTEGVLWMVLKQPLQVAPDQVAIFSRLYRSNARPLQAANGRLIKESR